MKSGLESFSTTSALTTTSFTPSIPGKLNMVSNKIFSRIDLKPLAPVSRSMALFAIKDRASSVKSSFTLSKSKSFLYCLISAFFGFVSISTKLDSSRSSSVAITGSLPTNSGIKPNFNKSSVSSFFKIEPIFFSFLSLTSA